MRALILPLAAMLLATGCSYTMPNGEKMPREVFRAQHTQQLMTLATAADREYDTRNPIMPPPAVCTNSNAQTMTGMDLAYCSMAMATYNAQLQLREHNRTAQAEYATAILDRQSAERERKVDRWFQLGGLVYQTERGANKQASATSNRISVRGHTVTSRGSGGGGGAGGGGAEGVAGAGSGGGAETGVNGDQIVIINTGDRAQTGGGSASTFMPVLEYAEDLGSTRPVYGEGSPDSRSETSSPALGLELF